MLERQACLCQSGKNPAELNWSRIDAMCCFRRQQILISRTWSSCGSIIGSEDLEHLRSFFQLFALVMVLEVELEKEKRKNTLRQRSALLYTLIVNYLMRLTSVDLCIIQIFVSQSNRMSETASARAPSSGPISSLQRLFTSQKAFRGGTVFFLFFVF